MYEILNTQATHLRGFFVTLYSQMRFYETKSFYVFLFLWNDGTRYFIL